MLKKKEHQYLAAGLLIGAILGVVLYVKTSVLNPLGTALGAGNQTT